jgi:hypothetical protein
MTRAEVRAGIAQFFGGTTFDATAQIYRPTPLMSSGLAGVRAYIPVQVTIEDRLIGLAPGEQIGAVMGVWLGMSNEKRLAIGGILDRPYEVQLWVWHISLGPRTETAQQHVDDLTEAVVARLRSDATLGGTVTQAGEGPNGITVSPAMPYIEPGASPRTMQDIVISFTANTYPTG